MTNEGTTTRASLGAVPQAPAVPQPNSTDARIVDLNTAYADAVAGNSNPTPAPGTGVYYLRAWIADNPPHPEYSDTYASQLIDQLEQWAASVQAASAPLVQGQPSSAVVATTNPATGQTTLTASGTAAPLTILGLPWYLWAGGALALAVVAA